MKNTDICALGELLIDFTPAGKSEKGMALFERNPGGAPANVLAAAVKLGCTASFIGKVGNDAFGNYLTETVSSYGVDCSCLVTDPDIPTTLAFVTLDEKGDRSFSFYRKPGADIMLQESDIDTKKLADCSIFHFGSVSLTDEPSRGATLFAAAEARRQGALISYDPNYRPLLWKSESEAVEIMKQGFHYADIIKVSDEELKLICGTDELISGAKELLSYGASLVLVSRGARGAFYYNSTCCNSLATYDTKTIDTTGAGDAFLGAVLYRLRRMNAAAVAALTSAELDDIVDFANAAGSVTTEKTGGACSVPNLSQIEHCRRSVPRLTL